MFPICPAGARAPATAAQDEAEAVKWYRLAADQGNADAQNNLGWMYANGGGVVRNDSEAAKLDRKAIEGGNETAKNNLAKLLAKMR